MIMLPGIPKEGQCPECGVFHTPDQPHDRDSLRYQYTFYDKHGRWPSWVDAMEHCEADVKAFWTGELEAQGVAVAAAPEMARMNVYVKLGE